jgi:uncharacterized membrane protein YhfC
MFTVSFTVSFGIQFLLLLGIPIGIGFWFNRRWGLSWFLFFGGALAFVSALVVTNLFLLPGELGLLLSSITQMGALYLIYRFQLKTARTEREALMAGIGQAGIELILVGIFAGLGFVQISSLRGATDETLISLVAEADDVSEEEVEPARIDELRASIDDFWNTPWYGPLIQPINTFVQVLPLRNATDETLISLVAEADDIPEEEVEPTRIDALRELIGDFWNTPWYGPLIQPIQSLSFLPIQIALAVVVLRALTHNHWRPLINAMVLSVLSRILPLYGQFFGGLTVWLGLSLLFSGIALWFLNRLWPVVQAQTQKALEQRRKAQKQANRAK